MISSPPRSPLTTRLSGSAREIELRIRNIFQWKRGRPPVWLMVLATLVALSCGSLVACQTAREGGPTLVMDVQYYDTQGNRIEIPALALPQGEEPDAGVTAINGALAQLKSQGLAPEETPLPDPPVQEEPPPEYALEDISAALEDLSSAFPALCDEVERRLGKKLSANDLKILYTLYDHLALPAEVILMLVGWCTAEVERKYGPGRRPFLSQIRREGFAWARRGIDTLERAEEHVARLTRLRSREGEVLRLLDIPPRPLVERERTYIQAWDDMGFDDGAIRMAYEKTVLKKQSMDWGYMNGILRRWHEKGLHTAAAVQAGDRDPRPTLAGGQRGRPASAAEEQRAREDMERTRRLMEQMRREED